jgi:hypothetical protein
VTHRKANREPLIVSTVIAQKGDAWGEETCKVARTDAQRVLEALVAEYGVEAAVSALDNQGLKGSAYRYLLKPLHAEAVRRRRVSQATKSGAHES